MITDKLYAKLIKDQIEGHQVERRNMLKMKDYYEGRMGINHRTIKGEYAEDGTRLKPNNKLGFNFARLVIETNHSYLFSSPISYDLNSDESQPTFALDTEFHKHLQTILKDNNYEELDSGLGKDSSIFKVGVEVPYIDKNTKEYKIKQTPAYEWVFFSFLGEDYALRYFPDFDYKITGDEYDKREFTRAELYSKSFIKFFKENEDGIYELENEVEHFFDELHPTPYSNQETDGGVDPQSDIENIVSLIDAYNLIASSSVNVVEMFGDPFLVLQGFGFDEQEISQMVDSKVIVLNGENAKAFYLKLDMDTALVENMLNRLERQIFTLSFTPSLFAEEKGGDMSGTAIRLRMYPGDLKANAKEKSFLKSLRKRIRLIARQLEKKSNKTYFSSGCHRRIAISFNRNIPQNLTEIITAVKDLDGIASRKTQLKMLPFVDDVEQELARIEEEQGTPINFEES
jgi:SPP1 family phage portal protein